MAKSANLYVRIEPEIKEQAEKNYPYGVPASNAINMHYKQIILQRGLSFEVKIPESTTHRYKYDGSRRTARRAGQRICGYESRANQRCKDVFC